MNKRAGLIAAVIFGALLVSSASAVELRFTETQMPLGNNLSVVPLLGPEYLPFGISVSQVYRYWDARDPFSDGAENQGGPDGSPYGLSFCIEDCTGSPARIDFTTPVSNLEVDWWTIGTETQFFLDVFDSGGDPLDSFVGTRFGTFSIAQSDIGHMTWHDSGGIVQVSNIRFDEPEPVPEPATIALFGSGLLLLRSRRTRD